MHWSIASRTIRGCGWSQTLNTFSGVMIPNPACVACRLFNAWRISPSCICPHHHLVLTSSTVMYVLTAVKIIASNPSSPQETSSYKSMSTLTQSNSINHFTCLHTCPSLSRICLNSLLGRWLLPSVLLTCWSESLVNLMIAHRDWIGSMIFVLWIIRYYSQWFFSLSIISYLTWLQARAKRVVLLYISMVLLNAYRKTSDTIFVVADQLNSYLLSSWRHTICFVENDNLVSSRW